MTLGLSITGAIFVNVAQNGLFNLLPNLPREQVSQVVSGTSSALLHKLPDTVREQALDVIVHAWRYLYVVILFPVVYINYKLISSLSFVCVSVGAGFSLLCAIFMAVSLSLSEQPE